MNNERLREKAFLKCPRKSFPCMRAEAKEATIMRIWERNSQKADGQWVWSHSALEVCPDEQNPNSPDPITHYYHVHSSGNRWKAVQWAVTGVACCKRKPQEAGVHTASHDDLTAPVWWLISRTSSCLSGQEGHLLYKVRDEQFHELFSIELNCLQATGCMTFVLFLWPGSSEEFS